MGKDTDKRFELEDQARYCPSCHSELETDGSQQKIKRYHCPNCEFKETVVGTGYKERVSEPLFAINESKKSYLIE